MIAVRRLWLLACGCLPAGMVLAQVSVLSPAPDAVSLTIYRDDLALVTETRQVELPAGEVTLQLQGVVESLLPQSAVISGSGRALVETDYRFERLTPASLLRRSVGKPVTLVRTAPGSGALTRLQAIIESVGEGVVLRAADGSEAWQCSRLPERLEFSEVPGELSAAPTLSVRLAGGEAGPRTVTVSYLARGFSFEADYVAKLNSSSTRMNLEGWITLRNDTGASFRQAAVQLVAGRLNLLFEDQGGSRAMPDDWEFDDDPDPDTGLPPSRQDQQRAREEARIAGELALLHGCWPTGTSTSELPSGLMLRMDVVTGGASAAGFDDGVFLEEVQVTGSRIVSREQLGDYQLYRLPWPADLNPRQSKQVAFLRKEGVHVKRLYRVVVPWYDAEETSPPDKASVLLRWNNDRASKMGEPLPSGTMRVFEPQGDGHVFAGESRIGDTPVGVPVEARFANALDIDADFTLQDEEDYRRSGRNGVRIAASHGFASRKDVAVTVEVRRRASDGQYETPVVVRSSLRVRREDGNLVWRFRLPAGKGRRLDYVLEAAELRY